MELIDENDFPNFSSICRICLQSTDNSINIFVTHHQMKILSEVIMECAPIQVQDNDQLPQLLCNNCLENLEKFSTFRTLCIESDNKLRQILNIYEKKNIKEDPDNPIESCQEESIATVSRRSTRIKKTTSSDSTLNVSLVVKSEDTETESNELPSPSKSSDTYRNYTRDEFGFVHCKYCNDYFKGTRHLKRHVKSCLQRKHKFENSLKNDIEKKIVLPQKIIIKNYGPNQLDIKTDEEGNFLCPDCNKKFNNKYTMIRHWRTHKEPKFKCPECDKCFHRLSFLKDHIRTHTREVYSSCEFCGKCFTSRNSLSVHRRIHLGVKAYTCTVCNKSFTLNKVLKNHMRTHTGERPYVCDTCGKDFNRQHILKTHMMTHTGERRFECSICQKKFICKQHLTLHTAKHNVVNDNVKKSISENFI